MSGPITFADLASLVGLIVALAGLWWRLEAAISKVRDDAQKKIDAVTAEAQRNIDAVRADLAEYKTEVAKDYARNGYLRDLEDRVLKRIDGLTTEIHGLRSDISDAVKILATQPKRRA